MGKQYTIEKELISEIYTGSWAIPQEQPVEVAEAREQLKIGVPRETFYQENRVPLTPETVKMLVANGHRVFVETKAGLNAHYTDEAYQAAGAIVKHNVADIFNQADYLVKISPLSKEELPLTRQGQTVISAVHFGSLNSEYLQRLMQRNITAVGFEFYKSEDGTLPLVQMMSEIAGVSSIHIASELLTGLNEGQGLLLGGITGIPAAKIAIIGAGTVGYHAARTALAMGARVTLIDRELYRLRRIQRDLGNNVSTAVAQQHYIYDAVVGSDVVIGAAFSAGTRAPVIVTEDMVQHMRPGSVVVDISIDQGGCIETSQATNHERPTFRRHDVIHYCVPNIPSRVARTASIAVSNILGPLLANIGDHGGIGNYIKVNSGLKEGIYVYRHHITKKSIARMFNMTMKYRDIGLLIATM